MNTAKKKDINTSNLDSMTIDYLVTALWSSCDENDDPMDDNYSIEDLSPEALENAQRDCAEFLKKAEKRIKGFDPGEIDSHFGHDFWLTRNHHGAGFWDGDYPEFGDELTEISHEFGEVDLYVGDDGKIYGG